MYIGLRVKCRYFLENFQWNLNFPRHIFAKYPNIKFHGNTSSGSRVVPCGKMERRTYRQYEANSDFSQNLRMRLKTNKSIPYRKIIAVYCTNQMGHVNSSCGRDVQFFNAKADGTVRRVTTGRWRADYVFIQNYYSKRHCIRSCITNRKVAVSIPAGVSGFFIDIKSLRSHYDPGVDSASSRNEYQEYFLGVKVGGT